MALGSAYEDDAIQALANSPTVPKPAPEAKFSAWKTITALPRGITEAAAQGMASTAEVLGGFGQVMGAYPEAMGVSPTPQQRKQADAQRQRLLAEGVNMSSEAGDLLREAGRGYRPDAVTAHAAEQVVYGFARGASKVVGGAVAAGVPGVLAAGAEEGMSAADDLRLQGVDLATRTKAGAVQGAGLALAALPLVGQTKLATAGLYAAGGPGGFMAQQAITREILQSAGYEKIGAGFDPFDPVGLAVATLLPAGFAAYGMRQQKLQRAAATLPDLPPRTDVPADPAAPAPIPSRLSPVADAVRAYPTEAVDAARVVLLAERRAAANPGAPDSIKAMDQHEAALTRAENQINAGETVRVADVAPPIADPIGALADFEARDAAPIGAWVRLPYPDSRGQSIAQVREVSIADLYLPELGADGRLQPEKRGYLPDYTARSAAGEVPPNIDVVQMEDGRLRVVDGHRRVVAAQQAGRDTIRATVSPLIDVPGDGMVPLTIELARQNPRSLGGDGYPTWADQITAAIREMQARTDAPTTTQAANPEAAAPARGAGDAPATASAADAGRGSGVEAAGLTARDTTQAVPADTNAPGQSGGAQGADSGRVVTEQQEAASPPADGFVRLYHSGSDPTAGGYFAAVPSGGVFDGFFALRDRWGSYGTGAKYFADVPETAVLKQHDLDYELDADAVKASLQKAMPWLDEEDFDSAWTAVIEDRAGKIDSDDLQRIMREDSDGAASWEAQRIRGKVAKDLGYQAVEMDDENGTSWLIVSGTPLKRVIPNDQSAPVSGGAPAAGLTKTDAQIGADLQAKIARDFDAAVVEYSSLPDAGGGKILNTDTARELSPDYLADRTKSAAVHEPASQFIKDLYARKLQEQPGPGESSLVLFTAGGTGAGKTSALSPLVGQAQIVYDTNMNGYASSRLKIEQALQAGKDVTIVLVARDPEDALVNGALPRAENQRRKFGTGRTVPLAEHIKTHIGAVETVNRLAAEFAGHPNVRIRVVDNSLGKGKAQEKPLPWLADLRYNDIEQRVRAALESEYAAGRIAAETYRGFGGQAAATADQAVGGGTGSDRRVQPADRAGLRQGPEPAGSEAGLIGGSTSAVTERGLTVPLRYRLAEAGSLTTSHTNDLTANPAFPAELQPRDRARAASAEQISRIENAIRPELLGESVKASDGAPIVGPDAVVESGNARTIALRRAYESGKADAYRAWLADNAERFGLTRQQVEGMQQPVLVRERMGEVDRAEFARQANESAVASMSPTEQAMSDARRITDMSGLVANEDGTINLAQSAEFVRQFVGQVAPTERGGLLQADGRLSAAGMQRLRNAVFARAYGDADILAMLTESTDANVRNILAGMLRAAPEVAKLADMAQAGARQEADIAGPLVEAVRLFSQLRSEGRTVQQFLAQGSMFGDGLSPEIQAMLEAVSLNARAPKRIAEMIGGMVDTVNALGDTRQMGMFGDAPTGADAVAGAAERAVMDSRLTMAAEKFPDLQVQMDGMDAPMPMAEFLATAKAEADDLAADAPLMQTAVECALLNGPG